jgi:hypothetical protein
MGNLFLKALLGLALFDLLLLGRNFRRLHQIVSGWKVAPATPNPEITKKVCEAVNLAGVWYPKQALCLQRSDVTTCLLRSSGVAAEMVIGAQKLPFKAHAWVTADGRVINERTDVETIYGVWLRC